MVVSLGVSSETARSSQPSPHLPWRPCELLRAQHDYLPVEYSYLFHVFHNDSDTNSYHIRRAGASPWHPFPVPRSCRIATLTSGGCPRKRPMIVASDMSPLIMVSELGWTNYQCQFHTHYSIVGQPPQRCLLESTPSKAQAHMEPRSLPKRFRISV